MALLKIKQQIKDHEAELARKPPSSPGRTSSEPVNWQEKVPQKFTVDNGVPLQERMPDDPDGAALKNDDTHGQAEPTKPKKKQGRPRKLRRIGDIDLAP
jgi:hypothetical protein